MPNYDAKLRLAENQAITANGRTIATNVIPLSSFRDAAMGEDLYFQVHVSETFSGGGYNLLTSTISIRLYQSLVADIAAALDFNLGGTVLAPTAICIAAMDDLAVAATLTAGKIFTARVGPTETSHTTDAVVPQFWGAAIFTNNTYATGKLTLDIVKGPGANFRKYPASYGSDAHVRNLA